MKPKRFQVIEKYFPVDLSHKEFSKLEFIKAMLEMSDITMDEMREEIEKIMMENSAS